MPELLRKSMRRGLWEDFGCTQYKEAGGSRKGARFTSKVRNPIAQHPAKGKAGMQCCHAFHEAGSGGWGRERGSGKLDLEQAKGLDGFHVAGELHEYGISSIEQDFCDVSCAAKAARRGQLQERRYGAWAVAMRAWRRLTTKVVAVMVVREAPSLMRLMAMNWAEPANTNMDMRMVTAASNPA